ncbi:zeta toxin family protein [Stenotrophomonas pavanii]|uniref:zeta toxin family protein n=1 Tax=Stenotrophomonas pavanii TaxID=487698 RepID=UPI002ACDB69E|nr:zeta toxin family protein [Stenotrophomonas pavanii]MDZ7474865.1 zeta toxin family protein [Stenotrophomonas pavanii]
MLPHSGLDSTTPQERPKAIVLAGQPGAGKSGVAGAAIRELAGDAIPIDPDALREMHRDAPQLVQQHPYTWSGHTHSDASRWAKELRWVHPRFHGHLREGRSRP